MPDSRPPFCCIGKFPFIRLALAMAAVLLSAVLTAAAEPRTALVIGNGRYGGDDYLPNATGDARAIARTLRQLDFRVIEHMNLTQQEMEDAINEFGEALGTNGGTGLFFYSGHGLQAADKTFLLPLGVKLKSETDARFKALDVEYVIGRMEEAGSRMNLVILDACRDAPFARSLRTRSANPVRGLSRIDPPQGTLIAYATSPRETAQDGSGSHSPYTAALLETIVQPGLPVEKVFKDVRVKVAQTTTNKQTPWYSSSLLGEFYFKPALPGPNPPNSDPTKQQPVPPPPGPKHGQTFHDKLSDGTSGPLLVYLEGGSFAMGSPAEEAGRDADERLHTVSVDPFYLMQTEVTVGDFRRFVEAKRYLTDAERDVGSPGCYVYDDKTGQWAYTAGFSWRTPGFRQTDQHPVVCVSHNDAVAYAGWLSAQTGTHYRLPTEAEWEYAARAGTTSARFWGADDAQACRYANGADRTASPSGRTWNDKFPCEDGYWYTAPVGSFAMNPWNLSDLLGNVWEWTGSAYQENYAGAETLPVDSAEKFAGRGGGWYDGPAWVRSANRDGFGPTTRGHDLGFRLSRTR